jgi:phosphatidate cytidylyltransferase
VSNLAKRLAFAGVAIPVVLALVWTGGLGLAVLLAVAAAVAAWEFYAIAAGTGSDPLSVAGVVLSAAIPLGVHARFEGYWAPPVSVVMLVVLALMSITLWRRGATGKPLEVVAITLLGVFYTGGMLAFAYALRYHRFAIDPLAGTLLVLLPLLLTWGTDTGGMLFGKTMGKRKLMPSISPGKTVAGAVGGAVVSVVAAVLFVKLALHPFAHLTMSLAAAAAFGLVVSVAGQVGDLVESMLKREAGVKDSSALIPGHGGALDRVDSLLFTLPVSFVLFDLLLIPTP